MKHAFIFIFLHFFQRLSRANSFCSTESSCCNFLLRHYHDANFLVAKDQSIPEEYLSPVGSTALFNVARFYGDLYKNDSKLEFTAGAEGTSKGCVRSNGTPCHKTHDGGDAIDVRHMDTNGSPIRKDDNAFKKADLTRTKTLIALFGSAGFDTIYTGDQSRFGLNEVKKGIEPIHGNHLHAKRGGTPTIPRMQNEHKEKKR